MLTFLPFLRAVKTPCSSLGVYGLIFTLAPNCLPHGTARTSEAPATGPLPVSSANSAARAPHPAVPHVGPAATDTGSAPNESAELAPLIVVDLPYPADARPRATDPTRAAAEDDELARWNAGGSSEPNAAASQTSYHPGTRVTVDTRAAKRRLGARPLPPPRGLSYGLVQAQARSRGYWPFRSCFELGQRDKKGTGGETRVAFTIGLRGKVTAARLLDSKLGNATSAACMVREVQKLQFSPAPPALLRMVATIAVYPGDAESPAPPDAAVAQALPRGDFDPEATRARVTDKQRELDACFAEARATDPALWGRLALSVILEVDGSVHRVTEVESRFPNSAATRCVQALLASQSFPSVNGKPFSFVVPLRLGPQAAQTETGPEVAPSPSDVSDEASD